MYMFYGIELCDVNIYGTSSGIEKCVCIEIKYTMKKTKPHILLQIMR